MRKKRFAFYLEFYLEILRWIGRLLDLEEEDLKIRFLGTFSWSQRTGKVPACFSLALMRAFMAQSLAFMALMRAFMAQMRACMAN